MVAILVIATLAIFAAVELVLRLSRAQQVSQPLAAFDPEPLPGHFLHAGHTWAELQRNGRVRVGADEFVRTAVGHIDGVLLPADGQRVRQGEPLLTLTHGQHRMVLASPLSGRVEQINHDLSSGGSLTSHQWICALHPENLADELSRLRIAESARGWMRQEKDRLVDWLTQQSGVGLATTLPDGGHPVRGFLSTLEPGAWQQFESSFLQDAAPENGPDGGSGELPGELPNEAVPCSS